MPQADTDAARRAYWTEQLEAAYRFMFNAVLPYPVAECGEPLVSLRNSPGGNLKVTASVGLSCYPQDGADAEALLYAADQEMYDRKFSGRTSAD